MNSESPKVAISLPSLWIRTSPSTIMNMESPGSPSSNTISFDSRLMVSVIWAMCATSSPGISLKSVTPLRKRVFSSVVYIGVSSINSIFSSSAGFQSFPLFAKVSLWIELSLSFSHFDDKTPSPNSNLFFRT